MRPGIGLGTKQKPEEVKQMLGSPTTLEEVGAIFADFCRGKVAMLPWSEGPAAKETSFISTQLAEINENGYLTINSQPAVDGVKSSHPVHGWGPRNGYIYQKVCSLQSQG